MSIRKKGTCSDIPVIASSVFVCSECGHTEIIVDCSEVKKECPKCQSSMRLVSSTHNLTK